MDNNSKQKTVSVILKDADIHTITNALYGFNKLEKVFIRR